MKPIAKFWIWIGILIILSPLGLILPEYFKAKGAWGEWGTDEMRKLAGYIPKGLEKLSSLWNAPMPNYAFRGWREKGLPGLSFAYIISAVIAVAVIVSIALIIGRILAKKGE